MAQQPDDNDRAQQGGLLDYLDGVEEQEPTPPPASTTRERLVSAEEGTAAIHTALRSKAPLVVLRSTTGAGKSAEVRRMLAEQTRVGTAAIFVPTHRLGEQTQQGLNELHVSASRPVGVARVRLPVVHGDEAHACIHHEAAELLAQTGGRVREQMCVECPARTNHPTAYKPPNPNRAEGEEVQTPCPAYEAGASAASITILQQTLLASTLASASAGLRGEGDRDAPPITTVIIDEMPPLIERVPLAAAKAYRTHGDELQDHVREALGPLLDAIQKAATARPAGLSLANILRAAGYAGTDLEHVLAEARAVDGATFWRRSLPVRLARRALAPSTREHALATLATVAAATRLLRAIVEAAHEPDRPLLWQDEDGPTLATLAPWVRQVQPFLSAGGKVRLLDATAPIDALRSLWPELESHTVEGDGQRIGVVADGWTKNCHVLVAARSAGQSA